MDHSLTDQSSILRLIEDIWGLGLIRDQSFNERAASLSALFDFDRPLARSVLLDPGTGQPVEAGNDPSVHSAR